MLPADLDAVLSRWLCGAAPAPAPDSARGGLDSRMREFHEIDPAGGLAAQIIDSFRERVPPALAAMVDAAAVPDPVELGRLAHSLSGMAGNIGAVELAGIATRLEELARSGRLAGTGKLLDDLAEAYERTRVALDRVNATPL